HSLPLSPQSRLLPQRRRSTLSPYTTLFRSFVDKEVIPVATELEHRDEYPTEIVERLKEMGLFGLMIPQEYGGLGESLLTYALVVDRKSTRLNSSHVKNSYAVSCLKTQRSLK